MKDLNNEDLNKQREILCSWFGRFNIKNISILTKFIFRLNAIPNKNPSRIFFYRNRQNCYEMYMKRYGPRIPKTNSAKNKVGGVTL